MLKYPEYGEEAYGILRLTDEALAEDEELDDDNIVVGDVVGVLVRGKAYSSVTPM